MNLPSTSDVKIRHPATCKKAAIHKAFCYANPAKSPTRFPEDPKKKPDIIASAIGLTSQVAIEIKHANKSWTLKQLETALTRQLVGQYLRPADRRHGVLVITLHTPRTWRTPLRKRTTFAEVIAHLQLLAISLTRNPTGDVAVRVIGLSSAETEPSSGEAKQSGEHSV